MHVSTSGDARSTPLLLLHGGGVAGWMWEPTRRHLADGRRLLIPDLPGHGRSSDQDYVSHDETVAQLVTVLEREERPAAVAGFSLGAQLAVLLAARRPDLVDRVAVVSAQAVPLRAPGPMLALLRATAGLAKMEWFAKLQASALFVPEDLLPLYVQTSAGISRETLLHAVGDNIAFRVPDGWSGFPGPALILAGAREKPLMKKSAALLHSEVPHSILELVEGCGHGIPLQQPAWFARRIETWLG
ncbi:alpha/beta fold hydrolase [Microbacterium saperdae]|uniref:Pimeloyl-ACP methyl ester carboxylesterase n=1 Tax=Microbacterium saperdae TaxID=69368 RepID=A0A543BP15_9MICO|nr:alpha/beta hydrolase [Microbacterium saperdae]TQL86533.1 pimeloyl-ACP methyl ester carboxylesterase [Microbacterium saperdae]GGM47321.1 alpha/beta hydrolase [Microbacterium saperdae]